MTGKNVVTDASDGMMFRCGQCERISHDMHTPDEPVNVEASARVAVDVNRRYVSGTATREELVAEYIRGWNSTGPKGCPSGEPAHRWEFDDDSGIVFCRFCGVLETEMVAPDVATLRRIADARPPAKIEF